MVQLVARGHSAGAEHNDLPPVLVISYVWRKTEDSGCAISHEKSGEDLKGARSGDPCHLALGPGRQTSAQLPALEGVSLKKEGQGALRAADPGYKKNNTTF